MKVAVKVPVTERERGWGAKVDDHMVCMSMSDAQAFTTEFNSKNPDGPAPDWYMQVEDEPLPIDLTDEQFQALEESEDGRMWLSVLKRI